MANDTAAIHVLKSQLQLTDDDYRALLLGLVGKSSCKAMSVRELATVRSHMDNLAERMGVAKRSARRPLTRAQFERAKSQASPKERRVWALWHQLGRDGKVRDTSARALNAYIERQVQVSALQFCTPFQIDTVIESLKAWDKRKGA